MKEEYYISCTKEQFLESLMCSVNNYKHSWFSMRINVDGDSFLITPNITIMIRNPFRPRYVGKIYKESSGIKIVGTYKMIFLIKITLIIFVFGVVIEVITGNISKEMLILPAYFIVVSVFYLIPKRACQRFLREYFSTLTYDTLKKKDKI